MAEEEKRGLLTDIFIFLLIVGLGLAALYFSGHWDYVMKLVVNLDREIRPLVDSIVRNVQEISGSFRAL